MPGSGKCLPPCPERRYPGSLVSQKGAAVRRHLAAVMFTDLVGYTALIRRDESAGRSARRLHRDAVEGALSRYDGTLLQYFGDGSLCVFGSAVQAARSALQIQQDFLNHEDVTLRIGIDLGDIAYDEQGAFGNAVNVAARLEALCPPGGVLISSKVRVELGSHPDLPVTPLGSVRLKNVDEPVPVFAVSAEGLRVPDPGALTTLGPVLVRGGEEDDPSRVVAEAMGGRLRRPGALRTRFPVTEDETLGRLPLVGRDGLLAGLTDFAASVERDGSGRAMFLSGARGAGKTRVLAELAGDLVDRGWLLVSGRSYPTETGVPFAPFSNAFEIALAGVPRRDLAGLVPHAQRQLATIVPSFASGVAERASPGNGGEARTQLFWAVSQLIGSLSRHRPLLLVFEDLQWADSSSIDLLHFLVRQAPRYPLAVMGTFCEAEVDPDGPLADTLHSLGGLSLAVTRTLGPLDGSTVEALVQRAFGVAPGVAEGFVGRLLRRTGGNPFFVEATLRSLLQSGHLRPAGGRWLGWETQDLPLPRTVRESIRIRMRPLSSEARSLAEFAAVMGGRVSHQALLAVSGGDSAHVLTGIRELINQGVLTESEDGGEVFYDFSHPLLPETIEGEIPLAEARTVHARIGSALELMYGDTAQAHSDELAYHFSRAVDEVEGEKALRYLAAAGLRALERYAFGEAVRYLEAALDLQVGASTPAGAGAPGVPSRLVLLKALAKACLGKGDHREARVRWREALQHGERAVDAAAVSGLHRRLALSLFSSGDMAGAWSEFDEALTAAKASGDDRAEATVLIARGVSLQHVGRSREAEEDVNRALQLAQRMADTGLVVRAERGLLLIRMWKGDFRETQQGGERLRVLADQVGNRVLAFWSEWTLAATSGLRGDTADLHSRIGELERIAEELNAPALHLWAAELSLEERCSSGDWELGVGLGEQAAALARSLEMHSVLPRLLVWLSLIYIGKGDLARAGELVEEAWTTSGAERVPDQGATFNIHTVVPAYIGRTAYFLAMEDWDRAIEFGRAGLAIVEGAGYVVWAVHRLLPLVIEAHLYSGRLAEAEALGRRLTEVGEAMDHKLARAWGEAGQGLVAWLKGDVVEGTAIMTRAAEMLEEIPLVFDAARLRRQVAGRLWDLGRAEEAVAELTRVHQVFSTLGADRELEKTLGQFAEMGAQPPTEEVEAEGPLG